MRQRARWLLGAALLGAMGCGDGGTAPPDDNDGARLASQFERLADSVGGAGLSATAEALRHAAEIVRLTGHATPVTLTIDGASRSFLAVAEQLDIPTLQCTWPSDSGVAPPGDTVIVQPGDSGANDPMPMAMDSMTPPSPGSPGECVDVGTFSMRTLIAWEPERMAEVVRIVADAGSNDVGTGVPDVMTGLPTNPAPAEPPQPASPPVPGDSAGGGSGGGGSAGGGSTGGGGRAAGGGGRGGGYPGFMGEYLVEDAGTWYAVEGSQSNALEASGGSCSADRATFDWAEFRCEAARFRFEFSMRVEALRYPGPPTPVAGMPGSPLDECRGPYDHDGGDQRRRGTAHRYRLDASPPAPARSVAAGFRDRRTLTDLARIQKGVARHAAAFADASPPRQTRAPPARDRVS